MASVLRTPSRARAARLRTRTRPWRRRACVLLTAAALALIPLPVRAAHTDSSASAARTDSGFEQQVLFEQAQEQGYACFRIPAVVRATDGTLLAFAEGRVDNCGDAGDIDLVLKRSTDGGRTWGPLQVIDQGDGDTHGNPAPIVDARTGRILLASTYNTGRDDSQSCDVPCDRTPHLQYSDDNGATWSAPRDLSDSLLPPRWNSWYATGPLHGIQLQRGPHRGRLLFTLNTESYSGGRITGNHAALAYSDDSGASWHIGAVDTFPLAEDGTFRQKPSEMTLVERADGSVYVGGREQDGTDLGHRDYAISRDGGESFTAPFRTLPDLPTPQVQGSILRLPGAAPDGRGRLLFSAPADPDRRRTMMIRSSWDEARTWDGVESGKVVTTDWSGYSDMVAISRDTVGLLYEGGAVDARDEIRFARFTEDWLGPRRAPAPTTDDRAPGARSATVLGGAAPRDGRFGGALSFDGADDAVRVPYRTALPLGTRDFTVSLWFRYSAASGQHPFLWMGGIGTKQPQVWLRGEPGSDRIRALITTVNGFAGFTSASVSTDAAYNDGQWHHLALIRGGGRLSLTVDGGTPATAPDAPGTVSRTAPFGLHLGQAVDSRSHMTGDLDEFRLYARALTDTELRRVREFNAPLDGPRSGALVRLPLDRVRPPSHA
ncbi:sialidase family protein [Streptomyces sp. RKCA744]|uniref:sialidase family protein n=1 Tax=Streptomyces sp. RKCA744 TaxID=2959340 RepID=UPI00209D96D6|nr:sialidase family protein [Streptomyces sp. RKCA744]MCO8306536.1 exo-alpha-sialidase [Streptomyces sp. RKCA744]